VPILLIAYFVCAAPLALAGLIVGGQKLFRSKTKLAASRRPIAAATEQPAWLFSSTALIEFFGGVGLILPMALGTATMLSPICAVALGLAHIGAFRNTLRQGERPVADIIVFALATVAAVFGFLLAAGV